MTNPLAHETFSPEFLVWLTTAPMDEVEGAYAENYKDAHGIKARWVYGAGISREEFAHMFVSLGEDLKEEETREAARAAAFTAHIESLGLTQWAKDNGIKDEMDMWEYEYRMSFMPEPPEFNHYEQMAGKAGFEAYL